MAPLAIGVEAGGANARAAVVDTVSGEIVAAHKAPLTDRAPGRVVKVCGTPSSTPRATRG